ncbi:MAG: hypothetical protein JWN86_3946 [Planctomycetota bacterium]|nr:hypothetical protein [Planctomycetota bacterium]
MLDWTIEHERFERVAYHRTLDAAKRAFKGWHERKRDDAVSEMVAKMWDQWSRLLERGKDPEGMVKTLIKWAILWVRYDRKVAGRARGIDVYDYRAGMTRQDLDGQGRPHPTERGDRQNARIDWRGVKLDNDPALWAEAKDELGL